MVAVVAHVSYAGTALSVGFHFVVFMPWRFAQQ
jgi:hypothetical protein